MHDRSLEDLAFRGGGSVFDFAKATFGNRGVCTLKCGRSGGRGWNGVE